MCRAIFDMTLSGIGCVCAKCSQTSLRHTDDNVQGLPFLFFFLFFMDQTTNDGNRSAVDKRDNERFLETYVTNPPIIRTTADELTIRTMSVVESVSLPRGNRRDCTGGGDGSGGAGDGGAGAGATVRGTGEEVEGRAGHREGRGSRMTRRRVGRRRV